MFSCFARFNFHLVPLYHVCNLQKTQRTYLPSKYSPDGKQDLSDSAAGIGGALVSPTTYALATSNNNNNNSVNNNCDDNAPTAPSSPVLSQGAGVGEGDGGGTGDGSGGGNSSGGAAAAATAAGTTSDDQPPPQQTTPKWPVKPGVHLHVNGLHSLGKSVKPINGFSYGTKPSSSTLPLPSSNGKK